MKSLFTVFLLLFALNIFSQDFVILKNGDEIKAKVLEINENSIDYKKFSNVNGPTYHMNKSEIFMIKYASGDKDVFNTSQTNKQIVEPSNINRNHKQEFTYNPNIGTPNCQVQKRRGAKIYGNRGNEVFCCGR